MSKSHKIEFNDGSTITFVNLGKSAILVVDDPTCEYDESFWIKDNDYDEVLEVFND